MRDGRYKLWQERRCRMCERPERVRPLTRHHLVPQWWFRERWKRDGQHWFARANRNANIVPLCRECHDLIDCGPPEERRRYRRMLRRRLTAGELAHARRTIGEAWLDRNYPVTLRSLTWTR